MHCWCAFMDLKLIDDDTRKEVKKRLSEMQSEVRLLFFSSNDNCAYCPQAKQLLEELASLDKKLKLEVYDINEDKEKADEHEIKLVPALVLLGKEKGKIRFFGLHVGYEFASMLADIIDVSTGTPSLPHYIIEKVRAIDFKVHIKVFATPTCPYCPGAVKLAHDFAILNANITADMIEISEYPELADKYEIQGVPKTVINDKVSFVGGQPPELLLSKIMEVRSTTQG